MDDILEFEGDYRWLSNFWPATVVLDGQTFPSVEHAYQAAKVSTFEERIPFVSGTAGHAKKLGQRVEMRADWEDVKIAIMHELVMYKFTNHDDLREKLLATGNVKLVEGNYWHDTFWGVCKGVGKNHLGQILMNVRFLLRLGNTIIF